MIGTTRTAFNGAVRGKVVSVTATGVILGGQSGMVREINARNLDPITTPKNADGTRDRRRPRRFTPKPKSNAPTKAETPSPKVSTPKAAKTETVYREAAQTDLQRFAGILGGKVDRKHYADK